MRADVYLVAYGHASSRKKAQDLIDAGAVSIDGINIKKSSVSINEQIAHDVVIEQVFKYVSRGGMKLEAALDAFSINVKGRYAVDIGASTGGFTDCLLKRGAASVVCVDSGVGQLHESLRGDSRVTCIERFNARMLDASVIGGERDVATCDVSFISQTYLIPQISSVLKPLGIFISLIKPQFEAGKSALGKNGVVHSAAYRFLAVKRVLECAEKNELDCMGLIRSPIEGGDGNKEYLAYFIKRPVLVPRIDDKVIKRITSL